MQFRNTPQDADAYPRSTPYREDGTDAPETPGSPTYASQCRVRGAAIVQCKVRCARPSRHGIMHAASPYEIPERCSHAQVLCAAGSVILDPRVRLPVHFWPVDDAQCTAPALARSLPSSARAP